MENVKKENFLSRIINKIKEGWERLGEPDINDGMDKDLSEEVERLNKVQEQVHAQGGFVQKAEVDEGKAQVVARGKASNRVNGSKVRGKD